MTALSSFFSQLQQPEYVHVLLNPIPVYGMAFAALLLLGGWIRKDSGVQTAALIAIAVVAALTWAAAEFGEEAYDRVLSMSSGDAQLWLKAHAARADKGVFVFYGTGILAVAALVARFKKKPVARPLVLVTLVLSFLCAGVGSWIAHAGGKIRHSEFREGPPPDAAAP